MPNRQISVFNPEGTSYVTDEERLREQQRQYNQNRADRMLAMEVQNRQMQSRAQPQSQEQSAPAKGNLVEDLIRNRPQIGGPLNRRANYEAQLNDAARFLGDKDSDQARTIQLNGDFAGKSAHEIEMQKTKDLVEMGKLDAVNRAYADNRSDGESSRALDVFNNQQMLSGRQKALQNPDTQEAFAFGGVEGVQQAMLERKQKQAKLDEIRTMLNQRGIDQGTATTSQIHDLYGTVAGATPGMADVYNDQSIDPEMSKERMRAKVQEAFMRDADRSLGNTQSSPISDTLSAPFKQIGQSWGGDYLGAAKSGLNAMGNVVDAMIPGDMIPDDMFKDTEAVYNDVATSLHNAKIKIMSDPNIRREHKALEFNKFKQEKLAEYGNDPRIKAILESM